MLTSLGKVWETCAYERQWDICIDQCHRCLPKTPADSCPALVACGLRLCYIYPFLYVCGCHVDKENCATGGGKQYSQRLTYENSLSFLKIMYYITYMCFHCILPTFKYYFVRFKLVALLLRVNCQGEATVFGKFNSFKKRKSCRNQFLNDGMAPIQLEKKGLRH